ncbi:MAG: NUDIX hydrolase [bacterium]|nr:NUDIX hydrolase [bacterium]
MKEIPLLNFNEGMDSSLGEESVSDELYSKILDSVVVATADILCFDSEGKILLGRRTRNPQPDWWIIGGRMKRGESFHAAAARKMEEELGLRLKEDRFRGFAACSFVWKKRAQEPQNHGSHTAGVIMAVTLSGEDVRSIKPNDEYSELKWLLPQDIVSGSAGELHPAIVQLAGQALLP